MARRSSFDTGPEGQGWARLLLILAGNLSASVVICLWITNTAVVSLEKTVSVKDEAQDKEINQLRTDVLRSLGQMSDDIKELVRRSGK